MSVWIKKVFSYLLILQCLDFPIYGADSYDRNHTETFTRRRTLEQAESTDAASSNSDALGDASPVKKRQRTTSTPYLYNPKYNTDFSITEEPRVWFSSLEIEETDDEWHKENTDKMKQLNQAAKVFDEHNPPNVALSRLALYIKKADGTQLVDIAPRLKNICFVSGMPGSEKKKHQPQFQNKIEKLDKRFETCFIGDLVDDTNYHQKKQAIKEHLHSIIQDTKPHPKFCGWDHLDRINELRALKQNLESQIREASDEHLKEEYKKRLIYISQAIAEVENFDLTYCHSEQALHLFHKKNVGSLLEALNDIDVQDATDIHVLMDIFTYKSMCCNCAFTLFVESFMGKHYMGQIAKKLNLPNINPRLLVRVKHLKNRQIKLNNKWIDDIENGEGDLAFNHDRTPPLIAHSGKI